MNTKHLIDICEQMKSNGILNYILPGLDSHLLTNGKVRLFTSSREADTKIIPHSHRFDFVCLVLRGAVRNTIYTESVEEEGDAYVLSTLRKKDVFGRYNILPTSTAKRYTRTTRGYEAGATYAMNKDEIHSIEFSSDAVVLFFEGPEVSPCSVILEPWVYESRVPLFQTQPWMFEEE